MKAAPAYNEWRPVGDQMIGVHILATHGHLLSSRKVRSSAVANSPGTAPYAVPILVAYALPRKSRTLYPARLIVAVTAQNSR